MAAKTKKLSMLRLWFLPVLFLLAAFPASASLPRLTESRVWLPRDFAPLSIRGERDFAPERQGVFEGFNCELTLEPSIDPDGRLATQFYQNGSPGTQALRGFGQALDNYASTTDNSFLGGGAAFLSYFANLGASAGTPSTYVNQAVSDYNAQGGGALGVLGVANRYNPTTGFYSAASGMDAINGTQLTSVQQWSAGLGSGGSTLLLGVGGVAALSSTPAETAPSLLYHYTTAPESSFANGLWEGSSVTDQLYTDAAQASQELGIPVPNKVIPIQNTGQFVPNSPSIVQPSFRFTGGGSDFINPQPVPPSQLLPAQPIGPR
jgi:hypothetical protein